MRVTDHERRLTKREMLKLTLSIGILACVPITLGWFVFDPPTAGATTTTSASTIRADRIHCTAYPARRAIVCLRNDARGYTVGFAADSIIVAGQKVVVFYRRQP